MASGFQSGKRSNRSCYFENPPRSSGLEKGNDRGQRGLGVTDLVSTRKWLQANGLKRQKLDLFNLLPKIGFKLSDDYDLSLKKPVSSRYGNGLFPQIFRSDGHTFNIVCCKEKLEQIAKRLQRIASCLKERLYWLTSGSRRIFGIIEEKRICIVVATTTNHKPTLELLKKALQIIVEEQVSQLEVFNIILSTSDGAFHKESIQITHDTVHKIIEWIQNLSLPINYSSTSVCEAVLKAIQDKNLEAVYLLCEGTAIKSCQELLRNKVLQSGKRIPLHVNTFNCNDKEILAFLKKFSREAGGRFHVYETYKCPEDNSLCETNTMTLFPTDALFNERDAGKETSVASREDVVQLFGELEEARNTLRYIQKLIDMAPVRKNEIAIESSEMLDEEEENEVNEDSMSSKEWLSRYGLEVHGLELYDLLEGVAFKHKEGSLGLLVPPGNPDKRTSAASKETFVDARYCKNFPAIQWKSGETVHVHVTPKVQRDYEKRMLIVLNAVQQRLNWLKRGSRAVFGTVLEDEVYLLIDMSSSMEPKIPSALERIESLLHEQLHRKKKMNIITFNWRASAWKERLTEVNPKNISDAVTWLRRQPCGGSTNTYAALRMALADPNTQAIYLLTDGRPDQPTRAILAQVQLKPSVPIHTIAFNCNDEEANQFLYKLASSTHGRYHYYTDNDYDTQPPDSWNSEDIRFLAEELERGYRSIATVARLREECILSLWKGEIKRLKSSCCNPATSPRSWALSMKDIHCNTNSCPLNGHDYCSISCIHQRHSLQWPFVPSCCKGKQHEPIGNMSNRHLHAASTKTSRLRHKMALKRSMSSPREAEDTNEELKEDGNDEDLEYRNEEGDNEENSLDIQTNSDIEMDEEKFVFLENNTNAVKFRVKQTSPSVKSWLKRNKLSAKRLTIMDALSPTFIPHKAKHVPIINKHVLSKVFDDVFPLAHVMRNKNMQMTLVNPKGVDLAAYEKKVQKAIQSYTSILNKIIWNALPENTKKTLGSEVPLPFFKNKARLLGALRANNWPVAAEDIALLEREIEQGFKYLQMSHELQKSELSLDENHV